MNEKIADAQQYIDGIEIAKMQTEFRREFRGIYPEHLMGSSMMAVGPMQSFIGLAIKLGHLKLPNEPVAVRPIPRKGILRRMFGL